jgi:hypothetical protein
MILTEQRFSTGVTRRVRRYAAGVWGKVEKKREKNLRNEKIPLHQRAGYFILNLIFHYFIEKKRGCVTEREREGGGQRNTLQGFFYK